MKTLRIDERQVTVACHKQRWLYVYSGIERQHIFSFQDVIIDFCLDEGEESSWLLWAVSQEGRVYRITEETLNHQKTLETFPTDSEVNDAIFEEFSQDFPDTSFTVSTEASSHVSTEEAIFKAEPKVAAICVHTDILVIATIQNKICKLNLYSKKSMLLNEGPPRPCFSTTFTLPNPDFNKISLYVAASAANACLTGSGNLCLEPLVFNNLFGTQTSILDSAVLLLTISDGHVYYLPLKRWLPSSQPDDELLSLLCNLNSPIVRILVVDVEAMASEEQSDQLNISQLLTSFKETVSHFPGLLVCSLSGQCCLFSTPTNFKTNFQVMQKTLLKNGPIISCCASESAQRFFYSTFKNIATAELSFRDRLDVSEQVCKGFSEIKAMASVFVEGKTFLLCQSENGRFYSSSYSSDGFDANSSTACQKNTISDLLSKVDDITKKINQLNPNIKFQSQILSQLALASHICSDTSRSTDVDKQKIDSLEGSISVKSINGSIILCCQLTSSKMVLSSDWSILVETHKILSGFEQESEKRSNFKSVHINQGLRPGESINIEIVQDFVIPSDTRVLVNAWLVLNFHLHDRGLYSSSLCFEKLKSLENQGITMHVFESKTDFLDFLVLKESKPSEVGEHSKTKRSTPVTLIIDSIARKRSVFSAFEHLPMIVSESLPEKLTYKILIPDSLTAFLFDHACHDCTHRSCLLKDLLKKLKIIASSGMETSGTAATASSVTLDSIEWGHVTIGINQKSSSSSSSSNEISQYFMEIHAETRGTLVETVLALMRRIKLLLPSSLAKTLDVSNFISQIQRAKENLRAIGEDIKGSKNVNTEEVTNRLLFFLLDVHNIDYQLSCQLRV